MPTVYLYHATAANPRVITLNDRRYYFDNGNLRRQNNFNPGGRPRVELNLGDLIVAGRVVVHYFMACINSGLDSMPDIPWLKTWKLWGMVVAFVIKRADTTPAPAYLKLTEDAAKLFPGPQELYTPFPPSKLTSHSNFTSGIYRSVFLPATAANPCHQQIREPFAEITDADVPVTNPTLTTQNNMQGVINTVINQYWLFSHTEELPPIGKETTASYLGSAAHLHQRLVLRDKVADRTPLSAAALRCSRLLRRTIPGVSALVGTTCAERIQAWGFPAAAHVTRNAQQLGADNSVQYLPFLLANNGRVVRLMSDEVITNNNLIHMVEIKTVWKAVYNPQNAVTMQHILQLVAQAFGYMYCCGRHNLSKMNMMLLTCRVPFTETFTDLHVNEKAFSDAITCKHSIFVHMYVAFIRGQRAKGTTARYIDSHMSFPLNSELGDKLVDALLASKWLDIRCGDKHLSLDLPSFFFPMPAIAARHSFAVTRTSRFTYETAAPHKTVVHVIRQGWL